MRKIAIALVPFIFILMSIIFASCGGGDSVTPPVSQNSGKISFTIKWTDMDVYNTDKLLSPDVKYIKIDIYDSNNNPVKSEWIARDPNTQQAGLTFTLPPGTYTIDIGGYKSDKTTLVSHRRTTVTVKSGETSNVAASLGVSIINVNGVPTFVPPNPSISVGDEITFVNNTGTACILNIGGNNVTIPPYDPNNPGSSSYTYTVPNISTVYYQLCDQQGNPISGANGSSNVEGYSGGGGGGGVSYTPTPTPTATATSTATSTSTATPTTQTDFYVDDATGNDTTGNGTSGNPYKTIEKAVSVAPAGSTIHLVASTNPTTYSPASTITINKSLTIKKSELSPSGNECIVNFGSAARNFDIDNTSPTKYITFSNITITGVSSGVNGAVAIGNTSNVTVDTCVIKSNSVRAIGNWDTCTITSSF
jgi:hypothetical protein